MPARRTILISAVVLSLGSAFATSWAVAHTDSTASLRGISDAGAGAIWASGSKATVLRSEDEGYMWQQCTPPAGELALDFRAIRAFSGQRALVLSSGPGTASRLFETTDGCTSWRQLLQNPDAAGFWDALVVRGNVGYLAGDPVQGRLVLYRTGDGGRQWQRLAPAESPVTLPGEGLFAASNTSLALLPTGELLVGTGGAAQARILRLAHGQWSAIATPLVAGRDGRGIFSLAFRDAQHGVAVGGDYREPEARAGTAAFSNDGGRTWIAARDLPYGYRSAIGWDAKSRCWIAVGPTGTDISRDDGRTWKQLDTAAWHALSLPWAAGPDGRVGRLSLP